MRSPTGSFWSCCNHKALLRSSSVEAGTQSLSDHQLIIPSSVSTTSRHSNQLSSSCLAGLGAPQRAHVTDHRDRPPPWDREDSTHWMVPPSLLDMLSNRSCAHRPNRVPYTGPVEAETCPRLCSDLVNGAPPEAQRRLGQAACHSAMQTPPAQAKGANAKTLS